MNKDRRKLIDELATKFEDLKIDLVNIKQDEQDAYDNLPEGFQNGDKGDKMSEAIDNLESAENSLDELIDYLNEAKGE